MLIVAVLVAGLVIMEFRQPSGNLHSGDALLPGFANDVENITTLAVTHASDEDSETSITATRSGDSWIIAERSNYAADFAKVRAVLRALNDARIIEPKTANPELHVRLGLAAPYGSGGLIATSGEGIDYQVIIGDATQGEYRYARLADDDQTWLIDQNPELPDSPSDWLATELVDVDESAVTSVKISHDDGEEIRLIRTESEDGASGWSVEGMPDGRELRYSTIANGIAAALDDLTLTDVRATTDDEPAGEQTSVAEFTTDGGNSITATVFEDEGEQWLALNGDDHAGWQYQISPSKFSLLTRRWEDLLKPLDDK